ncbi:hypothetical protein NESM_000179300 [Novymonas esmeraldas]|uniref:ApaG domain-containing protein n=1 Tax=Novymonas esmeraldas TaxID=1808958 RepID=A0AAW0F7J2_9TRYP
MSVARSAYRQLLRVGKKVSDKYSDPNDMCFALFGVLVSRHDFMNAGYGSTFPAILRTCFLRPSIAGDPHDTTSARTSAAFDALRRLNELKASNAAFRVRELRSTMSDAADHTSATAAAVDGSAAAASSSSSSASSSSLPSTTAAEAATSAAAVTYPLDEEGVHLIRGSVLIERSSRRRLQNFTRHCVVCEPVNMTFPPYRFCVPPEPSYLLAVRSEFALYAITDVLLALSATSIFNAHRQACAALLQSSSSPPPPGGAAAAAAAAARVGGSGDQSGDGASSDGKSAGGHAGRRAKGGAGERRHRGGGTAATAAAAVVPVPMPESRGFPTAREDLRELVRRIPTRTVMQTDVLEVEVTTEYVCSNPAAVTSAPAPDHRARQSKDGAFSSTTPLKRGSASTGGGGSASGGVAADGGSGGALAGDTDAHLFLYYVYIRNRGPQRNPKRWHAQVLSHHLVVIDAAHAQVLEMGRPGVVGNFPLLQPGASHCFESGTTLSGPEGLLRGSIQVNLFNDAGEVLMLDAAIAPTRLTVEVTCAMGFTSSSNAKDELVQRSRDTTASTPDDDDGDDDIAGATRAESPAADSTTTGESDDRRGGSPKSRGRH